MDIAPIYRYRATIRRVVDGDTYEMDVDLGMRVHHHVAIRLHGWGAAEMSTEAGIQARDAASTILQMPGANIVIETYKDQQTFARWVADIYVDGQPLSLLLRAFLHPGNQMG